MSSLLQDWLAKRFQVSHQTTLSQNRILIFIFGQGYVYIGLILVSFIAGINYGNNLILGFCFLIAAILWMSFYITFKQLHELSIELVLPEVGQVGQELTLQLHLKQPKPRIRYLKLECDALTQTLAVHDTTQIQQLKFLPNARGYFELPRLTLYSSYPFGLVRAWTYLYLQHGVWIAPASADLNHLPQRSTGKKTDELEEFRELRQFVAGDALQSVSWKHLARGQGLLVKVFDDQLDQQQFQIDYAHIPAANHEQKLSMMMAMVESCEQRQSAYALTLPRAELALGQGQSQAIAARQLLAQA